MKIGWLIAVLVCATATIAAAHEPIIDMHLHGDPVDDQGPPPMAMCTPLAAMPVWDQRSPYADQFIAMFKHPQCKDPVWSPTDDAVLMRDTIAAMEKLNIVGVLSASPDRVAAWRKAAPGRFLSGLNFQLSRGYSVEEVAALHARGQLDVLAEVTTQYEGVAPTDPRLNPIGRWPKSSTYRSASISVPGRRGWSIWAPTNIGHGCTAR